MKKNILSSKYFVNFKLKYVILLFLFVVLFIIIFKNLSNTISNPLYVNPEDQDFSKNPKLLERIIASPHGYFRFINIPFSNEVCHRMGKVIESTASLNLHGDAHVEQYAVTDLGRGLTDFDDSSTGPGYIDIMRFGVSIQFACLVHGWEEHSENLFESFLQGYHDALINPDIIAPEPQIVKRIKSKFSIDRRKYFEWVDSQMEPMPDKESESLIEAMKPYIGMMYAEDPELNEKFFDIMKIGYLHMGIGSALDLKYLMRVHGKTDDPNDDIVMEIKQVRDLSDIDCIDSGQKFDPFRIIRGIARIAYQPFHYLGYFRFKEINFWVHSWVDNYKEVEVGKTFRSPEEFFEIAYDVGIQLGKGHVKYIAAPFDLQLRRWQLLLLENYKTEIKKIRAELVELVLSAWKKFSKNIDKN